MTDITLSIIIPVYNNVNFTKNCLLDLIRLPADHEIIVVDNGSTDGTDSIIESMQSLVRQDGAKLHYLRYESNLGFGRANNKGYLQAKGKNILFLNNDIRVQKNHADWTKELIKIAESGALVSANGGLLDSNFNFVRETDVYVDSPYFYLSGWCLAGSKETFEKFIENEKFQDDLSDVIVEGRADGPWCVRYFAYFEDDHLSFKAKQLGILMKVQPVPVTHFGRMTGKKLDLSKMYKESREIFIKIWSKV